MKKIIVLAVLVLFLSFIFIFNGFLFTGKIIGSENHLDERLKLGYCPTMKGDAEALAQENNYELITFGSSYQVLSALKNNQIDKGLIGRKAKLIEINSDVKETVLKSGYTLVSSERDFIDYHRINLIEIHTYLSQGIVESLTPFGSKIVYYNDKNEALEKLNQGEIVLVSWDDWQDEFELLIVMDGNEKVKDFRGVFLYER